MERSDLPPDFIQFVNSVKGKRAKIVVKHILEYGYITTTEIETLYGYKHPPRAVRDVREQEIPIETYNVQNSDGRTIAAYRFGDPNDLQLDRLGGRYAIPKRFKQTLIDQSDLTCAICDTKHDPQFLQVDHRVPYEVAGELNRQERELEDFMLLCRSCNRAKSWTCEHCQNFIDKQVETCKSCYWASPLHYDHIGLQPIRRVDIVWADEDVVTYDIIRQHAENLKTTLQDFIKEILKRHIDSE